MPMGRNSLAYRDLAHEIPPSRRPLPAARQPRPRAASSRQRTALAHLGSPYADEVHPKIALAVLLRGNTRRVKGPTAAQVAGLIYRKLREQNYFAETTKGTAVPTPSAGK